MKAERRMTNGEWKTVALGDIFDIAQGSSATANRKFITDRLRTGVNWIMIAMPSEIHYLDDERIIRKREEVVGWFIAAMFCSTELECSFGRPVHHAHIGLHSLTVGSC